MSLSSAPSTAYFSNDKSSDWNIRLSPITSSLKLISADATPISKHRDNKLSSPKSINIGTSGSLTTF